MADTTSTKTRTKTDEGDQPTTTAASARLSTSNAPDQPQTADDVTPAISYAGNGSDTVKLNPETHAAHDRNPRTDI